MCIPLVVDLDGTLIKTDLLIESFCSMLKQSPYAIFLVPFWLVRGKAHLKHQLAARSNIEVQTLPYHPTFLTYLREEFQRGRTLVLATASVNTHAQEVADYLGIFTSVIASDTHRNLKGRHKLQELQALYGDHAFDYAGNSAHDLHIFPHARHAILVNPEHGVARTARRTSRVQQIFLDRKPRPTVFLKAIRHYQWLKNLLLFVPLLTSHQLFHMDLLLRVFIGFLALSCCASAGYIFNDLLDLRADRRHPRKRYRPFASGEISLVTGCLMMAGLLAVGGVLAATISWRYLGLIGIYLALTMSYSTVLKTYVLIDVLTLAGLYTLRVIGGAEIIHVTPSFWLLAFSMFIFFSLALIKRSSELLVMSAMGDKRVKGRDYLVDDQSSLREMGIASGYLAVVVVSLYINSSDVIQLYTYPAVLWLLCPILLYWISRLWLKTGRGEMKDDPILFALNDRGSRYLAFIVLIILAFAI